MQLHNWVTEMTGRRRRTGQIVEIRSYSTSTPTTRYLVQFGSGGPYAWRSRTSIRPATQDEIDYQTGR